MSCRGGGDRTRSHDLSLGDDYATDQVMMTKMEGIFCTRTTEIRQGQTTTDTRDRNKNKHTLFVRFKPRASKYHIFFSLLYIYLSSLFSTFTHHDMANEKTQHKLAIEKLDGTNYQAWKRDMQMVLIKKGVWEALGMVPDAGNERKWRRAQQLGLTEIHLACEAEQKQLISEAIDMSEAWDIVVRRHEASSVANVMRLEQEFVSF